MSDQLVLRVLAKMMIPFILVFGFYVITHGELGPGGGFQGGAILAAAVILYALVFGVSASKRVLPVRLLDSLMALGICLYAGVGVLAIVRGKHFLDYSALDPQHPQVAGPWGMTLVEYGVAITVAAVMITIFTKLAEEKQS